MSADKQIKVQRMEPGDIKQAANIHQTIIKGEANGMEMVESRNDIEGFFRSFINNNPDTCLVAMTENRVVGFIVGCIKDRGFGVERTGWIELLGVAPGCMGEGIGKRMGEYMLNYFRKEGVKRIYTSVKWDSGDLIAFFKSIGFDKSDFINLVQK